MNLLSNIHDLTAKPNGFIQTEILLCTQRSNTFPKALATHTSTCTWTRAVPLKPLWLFLPFNVKHIWLQHFFIRQNLLRPSPKWHQVAPMADWDMGWKAGGGISCDHEERFSQVEVIHSSHPQSRKAALGAEQMLQSCIPSRNSKEGHTQVP